MLNEIKRFGAIIIPAVEGKSAAEVCETLNRYARSGGGNHS